MDGRNPPARSVGPLTVPLRPQLDEGAGGGYPQAMPSSRAIERVFAACFLESHRTVLIGGADEPLYAPSRDGIAPHRVFYRADYASSALHEAAHWCIAGHRRRQLEDYGYWYEPDGRSEEQQRAFEAVEAAPQALESLFAEACGVTFHLSADNLDGGGVPSERFAAAVTRRRTRYLTEGLPRRAALFREALRALRTDGSVSFSGADDPSRARGRVGASPSPR